jgi:CheY-like chemotaxis protein
LSLIFPASLARASADHHTASPRPAQMFRILVIDDDERVLNAMDRILKGDGHSVTLAGGGQVGIDTFAAAARQGEPFDFVISDLGMPYVDGRKVAAAVKATSPGTPVLMVTGWGYGLHADSQLPAHVDRVLNKPTRVEELRRALAECAAVGRGN